MAYTIQQGDTLSKIAQANNTTVANLQALNPQITNPNLIYAGQPLAISADTLGNNQKPADLPTFNAPPTPPIIPPAPITENAISPDIQAILNSYEKPTKVDLGAMEQQAGISDKTAQVANLTGQINNLLANQRVQEAQIGKEAISAGAIRGRNTELERQNYMTLQPLQVQLAIAQGDLQTAQAHVDKMFAYEQDYQKTLYDYKQNLIDKVYEYATKQEQAKLDAKKLQNEQDFTLKRDELSRQHDIDMENLKYQSPEYQLDLKLKQAQLAKLNQGEITSTGILPLAQSQSNINNVSDLLKSKGISSSVGTSFLTRTPTGSGFWGTLGSIAKSLIKAPLTLGIGTYKDIKTSMTGERQNFIAGVEQLSSQLSLDSLIKAKAQGATFGALSDTEMQILTQSATKIGKWAIKNDKGQVVGYNTTEKAFKQELDKINNFAKLDYLLKGGNPADVGVQLMDDGHYYTQNSDGSYVQLQ